MASTPVDAQKEASISPAKLSGMFDVGVNERLPIGQGLALGLQNIFGMTGMFVFPGLLGRAFHLSPYQTAYLYGMTFIVCGIITTFQSVLLLRLPIIQGPYAGCFVALLAVGQLKDSNLGAAYGSLCVASLILALLSIPIRNFSLIGFLARYLHSPLIAGMMVIFIVLQMSPVALPNWIGNQATPGFPAISFFSGLVALLLMMALAIWAKVTIIRRLSILIALAVGTICFSIFQPIGIEAIARAPLLVEPRWFPFGFSVRADFVVVFLLTLIPGAIGSMSLYHLVADWGHETLTPSRMSQGIFAVALGSALAGVIGGFNTIAYPDNIGMMRATRVGSRYATLSAGLLLIVLGCCIKLDFLLVLVPITVLSAIATLFFGIILMHGIQTVAKVDWDDRKLVVTGVSVMVALGGLFIDPNTMSRIPLTLQLILKQPVISGGVILVILHSLLCTEPQAKGA